MKLRKGWKRADSGFYTFQVDGERPSCVMRISGRWVIKGCVGSYKTAREAMRYAELVVAQEMRDRGRTLLDLMLRQTDDIQTQWCILTGTADAYTLTHRENGLRERVNAHATFLRLTHPDGPLPGHVKALAADAAQDPSLLGILVDALEDAGGLDCLELADAVDTLRGMVREGAK